MTYLILVEPAAQQRQAFARWCLAQDPPIMTASASGSEVPSELFADIPDEVLFGSYVDGHLFRPVLEGLAPSGDGYADKVPVDDGAQPEVLPATPAKKTAARRRSTKKAETQ